jgi:hypothetical protein
MPRAALHEAAATAHRAREIDPTRIITHTLPLDEAEHGFEIFKNKQDNCEKVVLKPMAPGLTRGNGRCNSAEMAGVIVLSRLLGARARQRFTRR